MLAPVIVENLLPPAAACAFLRRLEGATYVDGRSTAGRWAVERKQNSLARPDQVSDLALQVCDLIAGDPRVSMIVIPQHVVNPLFMRYAVGDFYGRHEDNAWHADVRADISFTLFLNGPASYVGGDLLLGPDRVSVRGAQGTLVLYPAGTRHEVQAVTAGVRHVAVGWIQSLIRDPIQRDMLVSFGQALELARAECGSHQPWLQELNMLRNNLFRMWGGT